MAGSRWRERAVCLVETGGAPELWTSDRRPPAAVRTHLEQICRRCPVRRDCAAFALTTGAQCGMYAGVWVPEGTQSGGAAWAAAMGRLRTIADTPDGAGGRLAVGVPA